MKASEIEVGGIYTAKVSGRVVRVQVERLGEHRRRLGLFYHWECRSLDTGRKIIVKSPQRFRSRIQHQGE